MFGFLQLNCRTALRRTLLLMALSMAVIAGYAQDYSKMSISTQMFLDEQAGLISFDEPDQIVKRARAIGMNDEELQQLSKYAGRPIAKAVEKDGVKFISAFIRSTDSSAKKDLEALGVEIECEFLDGKLFTALIPVDRLAAVSELAKVTRISVATKKTAFTNTARQKTNVDDVLTYSNDARNAGLPNAYDGSGVLLGVIDTGIDFNHIAFKDKNGNSRIKTAYVYNGSSARTYTGSQITSTLTDDSGEDHGTHTSSTAGGSSVTVSGTNVTVTDNHANATYGGMAPGADLYLAGINSLNDTYLANAFQYICNYADNNNMPVVVSNSWGSQVGPHDGTGEFADICAQYFSDSNPNHICLFAASNDAGGNGFHVKGTATSSNKLGAVIAPYDLSGYNLYYGIFANAWSRSSGTTLKCTVHVINSSGTIVKSVDVNPGSGSSTTVSLGSTYVYSGSLYAYRDYVDSEKSQLMLRGYGDSYQIGGLIMRSGYKLAVQFYPSNNSADIDIWGGSGFNSFVNTPSVSGYTWTAGTDDGCYSDEATIPTVISIGAYASKNGGSNTSYTIGDIASFSSWGTAANSPTGLYYPWITAPGARLIAGVNHNHTSGDYSYYDGQSADMVVNSSTNPYAYMEGTSMATPTAAGIVALWLQVAKDNGLELTTTDIKTIMKETAITDNYTNGTNASHFGNGKIDALAGIKYILDNYVQNDNPKITAEPTSLAFGDVTAGTTKQMTFTVTGSNLEGNITVTKSGNNFSVSPTTVTKATAEGNGQVVTVTFSPTANTTANYTGTITLSSSNATSVTVNLTGKGVYTAPALTATPTSVSFTNCYTSQNYTKTVTVTGTNLQGNVTASISGGNGMYTVSPTTLTAAQAAAGATVTITYAPTAAGTTNATLNFTTTGTGAGSASVAITGTAQGPSVTATPTSLNFGTVNVGESATQTFTVTGARLEGNISLAKSGNNFSIDQTSIAKGSDGTASATVTVTYTPTADGNDTGTVTLTSQGAETVTVSLAGTGHVLNPTINVSPDALTLATYVNEPTTQTFTVTGSDLSKTVYLALQNDDAGVFSLSQSSIAANVVNGSGREITVTFAPTVLGDYTATVRLTSTGAETKYVTLNASAVEHVPALTATPQSINFGTVEPGVQSTQTFTLNGEYLMGDVTLTLNDENGVFTLSDATVTKAQAEAGKTVTVGFASDEEAAFSGSVTVSTSGLQNITIPLTAEVSTGGTASDAYLNIAKYATIDQAGWQSNYVTGLDYFYKYTEYVNDDVAWLTLPVYGAWTGVYYNNNPQKWIKSNLTTTSSVNGTATWDASDIYLGSNSYFSSNSKYFGNTTNGSTKRTVTFYVTNTTAVKLLGLNGTRATGMSTYPTTMYIYECTVNGDGTLNEGTTAISGGSFSNATNNASINFEATNLNNEKIYKVEIGAIRGYLYEIGFQTPLNKPNLKATPAELSMHAAPGETATATFNVKGKMLDGDVSVALADANGVFTVATTSITKANAEAGTDVTVTFNAPATEGTFTGTVTLTSGALTATVNLTGVCKDGGTASDAYLNIAKYATIDEAGATVSNMSSIYKYTEHAADDCAWLTLSTYGAMQADANQNWLTTTSLSQYTNTWSAQDIFLGNGSYFTSSGYSIYGSGNQTFYVTNCTQVRALIKGGSANATLAIYECNVDENGTPTASSTATDTKTGNCSSSSPAVITSATIDASKVYMVRLTGGGSYPDLCEIGFQTPLNSSSLTAAPTAIDFIAEPGDVITETITLTGKRLTEDVTVTLTDENGVYAIDKNNISIAEADGGAVVTVTFNAPEAEGSYRGQVNFTSGDATAKTNLYGAVGEKGSAYSRYLDIAKYSTIGTGNWYEGIFANPYKWTENESDECAWLTLPAAMPYFAWNYNDQNWCGLSSASNGGWYGHQWTATDVFQGYEFFKRADLTDENGDYAHMMGGSESNSTSNTTIYYGIYNVTNCTQVKAYAYNNSGISSSYPTFIQIYELTENADGSLTQSDTRTDYQTSTTSGQVTMTSATLDANKVYLVAVGGYRGFTYEVAFRTPLAAKVDLATVVEESNLNKYYRIEDGDLTGVKLSADGKTLYCKDANGKAVNMCEMEAGQTDYVRNVAGLMSTEYDQSNWVALHTTSETGLSSLLNHTIKGVKGVYTNTVNPTIELSAVPEAVTESNYTYNVYVPCNFMSSEQHSESGRNYFFMTPKPMEVMTVHYAMWNAENEVFEIPTSVGYSNQAGLVGDVAANFSLYADGAVKDTLQTGHVYKFTGLACKMTNPVGGASTLSVTPGHSVDDLMVYPLDGIEYIGEFDEHGLPTAIDELIVGRDVKSVTYYNVHGQASMQAFDGVNIVEVRYTDGSRKVVKIFK